MVTKINLESHKIESYAIRKLTPKECFRIMGVRDSIIQIMQSMHTVVRNVINKTTGKKEKRQIDEYVVSASQQYKQAGNSIVVDVLTRLYEELWYGENSIKSEHVKVLMTTFSGYDSQAMAMNALREKHPDFQWKWAGWSEIDKYACTMHDLVFPEATNKALGDITKIDWNGVLESLKGTEVDLFTYSSPCQDISRAGKQMGLNEGSGTRSSLLWNVADAIAVLRPKFLLQENVAALVSKKFMPDFQKWLEKLDDLGYVSTYCRLNAKDYGVPQNRDRLFCVSMRKDLAFDFRFPEPEVLNVHLNDILEYNVNQTFFLNDEDAEKFLVKNNTDDAVFVQFEIAPTHENAMFLKTWIQCLMEIEGWNMSPDKLGAFVKSSYEKFKFNDKRIELCMNIPGFRRLYEYNIYRKCNGDETCDCDYDLRPDKDTVDKFEQLVRCNGFDKK